MGRVVRVPCEVATGICRDCVTNDHCGGPVPVCDATSGQCTTTCAQTQECFGTGGPNICDTGRGVCVDCSASGNLCQYCETETFSCVGCLLDADCPPSSPFCGPSFECTPSCMGDGDCPSGLFCEPGSSRCVECAKNLHCPGEVCQGDFTCG